MTSASSVPRYTKRSRKNLRGSKAASRTRKPNNTRLSKKANINANARTPSICQIFALRIRLGKLYKKTIVIQMWIGKIQADITSNASFLLGKRSSIELKILIPVIDKFKPTALDHIVSKWKG